MFRHNIPIGRVFGITIDLDYSWFLIFGLLAWILAVTYYPSEIPHWSSAAYWLMGSVTAVMLFVSVLIHELGHSLVARRYGLAVPRITLFVFGGVSQLATEPPSAAAEFWISIVGPAVSFALAALFRGLEPLFVSAPPLFALTKYLASLNLILGAFNLVPGFPLDGGRVLRAIVWRATGKYDRATSIAGMTGRFFGFLMIFVGVWQALRGNFVGGLWIAFIGWFLESAAASQLQLQVMKTLLGDHRVEDAMERNFPRVPDDRTVEELVDTQILRGGGRYFVVLHSNDPIGLVTLAIVRQIPRSRWAATTVSQIMIPLHQLAATSPKAGLWSVVEKMGRDGVNQLAVLEGNQLVGVLSREDIVHYLKVSQALSP